MQYHYLMRSEAKPSSLVSIRAWAPISGGSLWEEQSWAVHLHHFLWKKWQLQASPKAVACSPHVHCLQTPLPPCTTNAWVISGGDPSLCCPCSAGSETEQLCWDSWGQGLVLSHPCCFHQTRSHSWGLCALGLVPCSLPFCITSETSWFKFSKHPSTKACLVQFSQVLFWCNRWWDFCGQSQILIFIMFWINHSMWPSLYCHMRVLRAGLWEL